jgi:hypothetical protein
MWKTTHQLCEGRLGVAVAVCPDKSSVADCLAATSAINCIAAFAAAHRAFNPTAGCHNGPATQNTEGNPFGFCTLSLAYIPE